MADPASGTHEASTFQSLGSDTFTSVPLHSVPLPLHTARSMPEQSAPVQFPNNPVMTPDPSRSFVTRRLYRNDHILQPEPHSVCSPSYQAPSPAEGARHSLASRVSAPDRQFHSVNFVPSAYHSVNHSPRSLSVDPAFKSFVSSFEPLNHLHTHNNLRYNSQTPQPVAWSTPALQQPLQHPGNLERHTDHMHLERYRAELDEVVNGHRGQNVRYQPVSPTGMGHYGERYGAGAGRGDVPGAHNVNYGEPGSEQSDGHSQPHAFASTAPLGHSAGSRADHSHPMPASAPIYPPSHTHDPTATTGGDYSRRYGGESVHQPHYDDQTPYDHWYAYNTAPHIPQHAYMHHQSAIPPANVHRPPPPPPPHEHSYFPQSPSTPCARNLPTTTTTDVRRSG